ncbi:MAG: copper resistance protein CopC [Thermoleophilia bacterium]|nr:copper resistance protein CopC [Thermoleophilia bacterium]
MRHSLPARARRITATALVLLVITAATAIAHVTVVSRTPTPNGVLKRSPTTASTTFSGEIKKGTIKVFDAKGKKVSRGNGAKDPRNVRRVSTRLNSGLKNGRYVVRWNITAGDGHKQSGSYSFRIKK